MEWNREHKLKTADLSENLLECSRKLMEHVKEALEDLGDAEDLAAPLVIVVSSDLACADPLRRIRYTCARPTTLCVVRVQYEDGSKVVFECGWPTEK
jgi:hypothetical protein